jgi:enoyl-CoA hydratase/carnithine racemase
MADPVLVSIEDGVGLITLNRPERRNAVNPALGEALDHAMVRVATDPSARAMVITGAGPAFCSGADIKEMLTPMAGGESPTQKGPSSHETNPVFQVFPDQPEELATRYSFAQAIPFPVIAAVNGPAVGAGFALSVICDVRFASTEAAFIGGFPRRGMSADVGIAWTLPSIVGYGAAADILLSGRRITAEEAHQMGLVNRLTEPEALLPEVMAYARDIAANASPRSLGVIKRQLWESRHEAFKDHYAKSFREVKAALTSEDFREGVAAAREGRPPRFTGN